MKTHRIIFTPSVSIPLAIAGASGNTDCFLQQVEPTWLTFEHFRRAILAPVLDHSREQPDRFVFLVLQDINLASPECYARPFLEVHAGIRDTFPGTDQSWPDNLWVFLMMVEFTAPEGLGLPIARSTFNGCAGMPKDIADEVVLKPVSLKSSVTKTLPVSTFPVHQPADSAHLNNYFDE